MNRRLQEVFHHSVSVAKLDQLTYTAFIGTGQTHAQRVPCVCADLKHALFNEPSALQIQHHRCTPLPPLSCAPLAGGGRGGEGMYPGLYGHFLSYP